LSRALTIKQKEVLNFIEGEARVGRLEFPDMFTIALGTKLRFVATARVICEKLAQKGYLVKRDTGEFVLPG